MTPLQQLSVQKYISWIEQQPKFKEDVHRVCSIYIDKYSEDPDGASKALEDFKKEQANG